MDAQDESACSSSAIVMDNGSAISKVGLSTETQPQFKFPTVVGHLREEMMMMANSGQGPAATLVGEEAEAQRGIRRMRYPIEHGVINNWDDIEKIWHHTFYKQLRVAPEERNVLVSRSVYSSYQIQEKTAQIMFETFCVSGFYGPQQAALSLYDSGRTTGCVVDLSASMCSVVPVYEGTTLHHAAMRTDIGGRDLTECMGKHLMEIGLCLTTSAEKEIVRKMKEERGYVTSDPNRTGYGGYSEDSDAPREEAAGEQALDSYKLPDGTVVDIGKHRYRCAEPIFTPALIGLSGGGLPRIIQWAVGRCNVDLRDDFYGNIVLCGGSSLFPGMKERVSSEVKKFWNREVDEKDEELEKRRDKVKVVCGKDRQCAVWSGGAIFANLLERNDWVSKRDYDEEGPGVVNRKCCF